MPLLDLADRDLRSFLLQWAATVADALTQQLPPEEKRFVVKTVNRTRKALLESLQVSDPAPTETLVAPAHLIDRVSVEVCDSREDGQVAAAILFVTAENKEDSDAALSFAVQAAARMTEGAGVVIVDIAPGAPSWATHLHSLTGVYPASKRLRVMGCPVLVAQPRFRDGSEEYAVWHHAIAPGSPLPTVSLPLPGAANLTLDLDATYTAACARSGISG